MHIFTSVYNVQIFVNFFFFFVISTLPDGLKSEEEETLGTTNI